MKNIKNLFIGCLAMVFVATSAMIVLAQPSMAAQGDNPRCECVQTTGSGSGIGTWASRVDGPTQGTRIPQTTGSICSEVGISGACNPLTDTFISPGFKVPKLGDFLGNIIRFFFFIAGIIALIFLLIGAFKWITSSGKEEGIKEARDQIQAAVLGLIVMVAVLALVVIIEQVIFGGKICLGISCPLQLGTFNLVSP